MRKSKLKSISIISASIMLILMAVMPVQAVVISNPGFESGTVSWKFYSSDSAGSTFDTTSDASEGAKAARVFLNKPASNIQVYQDSLMIEPSTNYRLTFAAKSSSGHDLGVRLLMHGAPYTNYGLKHTFDLSTTWQTFTIDFTSSGFSGVVNDGRLMFWLAPYGYAGDTYYIDDVKLKKIDMDSENLIANPEFDSGKANWWFFTNGAGSFIIDGLAPGYSYNPYAHIEVTGVGSNTQLYQKDLMLKPYTDYRLTFDAYSIAGNDLGVRLLKHGAPYTNYGLKHTFDLTMGWQTFTIDFTTSGFTSDVNDGRLMFWLAPYASAGDHYAIDNVRLEEI